MRQIPRLAVRWQEVLTLLGVTPCESATLPSQSVCPLCHGTLDVYPDSTALAVWYSCHKCAIAGDATELSATVWQCSIAEAWVRLHQEFQLSPTNVDQTKAIVACVARYKAQQELWLDARLYMSKTISSLRHLRQHYLLPTISRQHGGHDLGSDLVGAITRKRLIEELPEAKIAPKWHEGLIAPYFSAPGRIVGWWLAIEEKEKTVEHFIPVEKNCAGIFGWQLGLQTDETVVFHDTGLCLKMHLRNMAAHKAPLPFVAASPGTPLHALALCGKSVTMCVSQLTPQVYVHARQVDAKIALFGGDTHRAITEFGPADWLEKRRKAALPWQDHLESHLQSLSATEAAMFVRGLGFSQAELAQFVQTCPAKLRDELENLTTAFATHEYVHVGGKEIYESEAGWSLMPANEPISNARLRIDTIVRASPSNTYFYRGRVLMADASYEFCEQKTKVDKDPFGWMSEFLLSKGQVFVGSGQFNKHVIETALRLGQPAYRDETDAYGWYQNAMVFPRWVAYANGSIEYRTLPLPRDTAAPDLEPPRDLLPDERLALLQFDAEAKTTWAVFACLANHLVAPILQQAASGVVWPAQYDSWFESLLEGLNLPRLGFPRGDQLEKAQRYNEQELRDRVPVLAACPPAAWLDTWFNRKQHRAMLAAEPLLLHGLAMRDWWTIVPTGILRQSPALTGGLRCLVSNYVLRLAQKRFTAGSDPVGDALEWAAEFIDRRSALPFFTVELRRGHANLGESLASYLLELLRRGDLSVVPQEFAEFQKIALIRRATDLWVPWAGMVKPLRTEFGLQLDWNYLIDLMSNQPWFCGVGRHNNHEGFFVKSAWFDSHGCQRPPHLRLTGETS